MAQCQAEYANADLARALGSELAAIAPFFRLFVSYCAQFPATLQALREWPSGTKVVAEAEGAIRQARWLLMASDGL